MSMISLQQTELCQYAQSGTVPVAFHRRTDTLLSVHKNVITAHRQSSHGTWGVCGSWTNPSSSTIGVFAVEAYNCFIVLQGILVCN